MASNPMTAQYVPMDKAIVGPTIIVLACLGTWETSVKFQHVMALHPAWLRCALEEAIVQHWIIVRVPMDTREINVKC